MLGELYGSKLSGLGTFNRERDKNETFTLKLILCDFFWELVVANENQGPWEMPHHEKEL